MFEIHNLNFGFNTEGAKGFATLLYQTSMRRLNVEWNTIGDAERFSPTLLYSKLNNLNSAILFVLEFVCRVFLHLLFWTSQAHEWARLFDICHGSCWENLLANAIHLFGAVCCLVQHCSV